MFQFEGKKYRIRLLRLSIEIESCGSLPFLSDCRRTIKKVDSFDNAVMYADRSLASRVPDARLHLSSVIYPRVVANQSSLVFRQGKF